MLWDVSILYMQLMLVPKTWFKIIKKGDLFTKITKSSTTDLVKYNPDLQIMRVDASLSLILDVLSSTIIWLLQGQDQQL